MRAEKEEVLAARVAEFKRDPDQLREVTSFVQELVEAAERSAETKLAAELKSDAEHRLEQERAEAEADGGKRRFGSRARGFVVRLFDALCHCSQTAAAAARHHTETLRAKR